MSAGWIAQYFAARGYAVLRANVRGMSGYGDRLPEHSPFKSWRLPVDDTQRAGQWLIDQGIADPNKLSVVGWGLGGYFALQSCVVNQSLFKAVVAVGPVTDLSTLKEQFHGWSNFGLMDDYVGSGAELNEASPAHNAAKIKVPVLLFHGALDRASSIKQSRRLDEALRSAGAKHELVTWPHLDDQLEDSEARAELLRRSDAFLRRAIGPPSN
ncbi:MAG: prolyl oligopeptidase family serine peptidase [Proteobacteria bacterium]|nr:prolyl oligopeptidase family serine peptidase [Pseudomonadota bacterium]